MGAPRYGKFLGIPGGLALAGCVHFRYGHLSHAVCGVSDPYVPMVSAGISWRNGGPGRGDRLCRDEHHGSESRIPHFTVVVLRALVAVRGDLSDRALQDGR